MIVTKNNFVGIHLTVSRLLSQIIECPCSFAYFDALNMHHVSLVYDYQNFSET